MTMDIRTSYGNTGFDWGLDIFELATDDGLNTAVILSLFTDRRVDVEELPDEQQDPRGWWGDAFAEETGDQIGSKLWLLARESLNRATLNRARDYALGALQWMVDDGVARSVEVTTSVVQPGVLGMEVLITRPDARTATYNYDVIWGAQYGV